MGILAEQIIEDVDHLDTLFPTAVTVTRTSEDDFKSRQVVARLDGNRLPDLLWGDSVTTEVEPGPHRLKLHNTLVWKTVNFHVAPGQQAFFEVVNRASMGLYLLLPVLGVGPLTLQIRRMV